VGEEEKSEFEDEREHQKSEKPKGEDRRADKDAPESDDVGTIREFAASNVGSEKRRSVENGGEENERREEESGGKSEEGGLRTEGRFFGVEKAVRRKRFAKSEPGGLKCGGNGGFESF